MSNHSRYLSQRHFGSLDGLRAISILAVIWHHTAPAWVSPELAHIGAQGVTLFFAISGFLITTLLLRERERNGAIDLKAFYWRRSLRIFPLYYGVLLLYVAVVLALERNTAAGQAFFDNLIYFASYTSNLFVALDGRVIFYFAWSLAAEEQFYLIWPVVLLLSGTASRACIPLCLVFFACAAAQLMGSRVLAAIPLAIVAGALLAITLHSKRGFAVLQAILGRSGSLFVLMPALALALITASVPSFIAHALFAALVGACVVRENHPAAALLSLKPIAYIGSISYGMYMLHMLCKNAVTKGLGIFKLPADGLEVFVLTALLTLVAASLSFRYYESFFLKLKGEHSR